MFFNDWGSCDVVCGRARSKEEMLHRTLPCLWPFLKEEEVNWRYPSPPKVALLGRLVLGRTFLKGFNFALGRPDVYRVAGLQEESLVLTMSYVFFAWLWILDSFDCKVLLMRCFSQKLAGEGRTLYSWIPWGYRRVLPVENNISSCTRPPFIPCTSVNQ